MSRKLCEPVNPPITVVNSKMPAFGSTKWPTKMVTVPPRNSLTDGFNWSTKPFILVQPTAAVAVAVAVD
eukprot:scaffold113631_cov28-Attheya_sp.AAC.1